MKIKSIILLIILLSICFTFSSANAKQIYSLEIIFTIDGKQIESGQAIPARIEIANAMGSGEVITGSSFLEKDITEYIRVDMVSDIGLKHVNKKNHGIAQEPPPPHFILRNGEYVAVEEVMSLPEGWSKEILVKDLRELYAITEPGTYKVQVVLPFRTYGEVIESGGKRYGEIQSPETMGTIESNTEVIQVKK